MTTRGCVPWLVLLRSFACKEKIVVNGYNPIEPLFLHPDKDDQVYMGMYFFNFPLWSYML